MEMDQRDEAFHPDGPDEALYDFSYDDNGSNEKSPDGPVEDECNMSTLDLYTDMVVRDSEEAALSMAKLKEEKTSFKAQLDVALLQVSKLSKENETLTKENKILKSNISVLLKTAKIELQRKERELNELRDMQISGMRPGGNTLSPRSRKTRRGPKHRQPPPLMRQNGAQHPPNSRDGNTRAINKRTGDSDGDDEPPKPNVRETMFVRRQRAKNKQQSAGKLLQSPEVPPSNERRLDGGNKRITDALVRLSQMSSQEEDKLNSRAKNADERWVQGQKEPKKSETQKVCDVNPAVQSIDTPERKSTERSLETVKEQSRSKSTNRATRSRSGERSSTKRSYDSSKHDQNKLYSKSPSPKKSSRSQLNVKNLSPSRASRSRSNEKRSSRSKSSDRMLSPRRSSRSKSHERRSSRSKSRERRSSRSNSHDKRLSLRRSSRSKSQERRSSRSKSRERWSSRSNSHDRRLSRSKSHERTVQQKYFDKPRNLKTNTEDTSERGSSSTSTFKRSRSERDRSPVYNRSRNDRGIRSEKYRSNDRHRDRDRSDNRRSSTPIRDSAKKDSKNFKEDHTKRSSVQTPSSSEKDYRRLERGQSRARERMSSIAKESVAKAKAMLNKRTSYSSPKKTHRLEEDRRRSSTLLRLDGLTDWKKAESGHRDFKEDDQSLRRKKERRPECNERKRKHRLSPPFPKPSQQLAKKRRAGSESTRSGREDIVDDDSLEDSVANPFTYEEGHTVLACGMKDSIECTSSKVALVHTSVSDAYDTTQSDVSFLYASGVQGDNGASKGSADDPGAMVNREVQEDDQLSEGEIVSDVEEKKTSNKSKHGSSKMTNIRSSKHKLKDHHSKSKEKKKHKSPRRGKKHKRRSSTDQETRERRKRLKENKKSGDSECSQTEETPLECKDGLVEQPVCQTVSKMDDSEIAQKISDDKFEKEKDEGERLSNEKPADDPLAADSEAEAIGTIPLSEPAMPATGDGGEENTPQTKTMSAVAQEMEDKRDAIESGGKRMHESEDVLESDIVDANLETEPSPAKSIPSPVKRLNCAEEPDTRHDANEADAYASRGVLFEDLCLSSSMDDTSLLSCAEPNTDIQRHSFVNSIEKVDVVIKEIEDPLVDPIALELGTCQKPPGTENYKSLGTTALDPHRLHVPPETITNDPIPEPSKTRETPCDSVIKEVIPDKFIADTSYQERINTSHTNTSVDLNTSKSSELTQDESGCADHVLVENNDAMSLLAASGELHSFMLDNTIPKVKRDLDLSLNESKDVPKEATLADQSMLNLTCEWSNIEFQDSSTKMGSETELGPVTLLAAPVFDDGCAQDMDYAKDPEDIDTSALEKGEHELMNKAITGDDENVIHIAETLKGRTQEKDERKTDKSSEASERATDLKSAKVEPPDGESKDKATGEATFGTVHLDNIFNNTEESSQVKERKRQDLSPNILKEGEKEMEQENIEQEMAARKMEGTGDCHVSYKTIVMSEEDECELDFEEDAEEENKDKVDEDIEDEEEEESVYIVDVQYATADDRAAVQEDSSCVDSEEEKEELNLSDCDPGSKPSPDHSDEPPAVEKNKGSTKISSSKSQSENNDSDIELDWGSESEDQNKMVGNSNICKENDDKDDLVSHCTDRIPDSKVKKDASEDTLEGIEIGCKDGQSVYMKEKIDGDQLTSVEDSEEEGEILEEEENIQSPEGYNRKEQGEKSRTNQRQESEHKGFGRSHHHRDHRDSSKPNKDRSSDNRRLTTDGKRKRRRSGSTDRRSHRELPTRDSKTIPKGKDRERTEIRRNDDEGSRRTKDQRRETSDRRREEDRNRAAFLEKKRGELQRMDRRREDERREARRLEDERRLQDERKRTRRREENAKVRSRLHDNEKKRDPLRKSKKVSEGRRP